MKETKDVKISFRLTADLYKKLYKAAKQSNRTVSGMVIAIISDSLGASSVYPCIISSGDSFIFVSPTGSFGELTKESYKRFVGGSLPLLSRSGDWYDEYDSMTEFCNALGTEVCRHTLSGIHISNIDLFIEMSKRYNPTSRGKEEK